MAEHSLEFAISLEDHVTPGAHEASESLYKLRGSLESTKEGLHQVIEPTEVWHEALEGAREGLSGFASALKTGDMAGAVEGLSDALASMASALDLVYPGLGQAASAIIRVGGAIYGTFVEIAEEGVKVALEVNEVNEKLEATFEALGDKPGAGKKTLEFLNALSSQLPQTRDQLSKWARTFQTIGITDLGALKGQIEATASAQAIGGDEAASAYVNLTEKIQLAVEAHQGLKLGEKTLKSLYAAGVSVTDVAGRMGMSAEELAKKLKAGTVDAKQFGEALQTSLTAKGKAPLEVMGNSLDGLKNKATEVFNHLFDGIDITPITGAIKDLITLGDQGNASGEMMHRGIKGAIQGIIQWMGNMMVEGEILFLDLEIWAVKHRGTLKTVQAAFGLIGDAILSVTHAIEYLFDHQPPQWLKRVLLATETLGLSEAAVAVGKQVRGNAEGGMVHRPAAGELFASVSPGEMILPKRQAHELMGGGFGARAVAQFGAQSQAGGRQAPHINNLHVQIQAPHGVTDATSLTAAGLALALEKHQLSVGR